MRSGARVGFEPALLADYVGQRACALLHDVAAYRTLLSLSVALIKEELARRGGIEPVAFFCHAAGISPLASYSKMPLSLPSVRKRAASITCKPIGYSIEAI